MNWLAEWLLTERSKVWTLFPSELDIQKDFRCQRTHKKEWRIKITQAQSWTKKLYLKLEKSNVFFNQVIQNKDLGHQDDFKAAYVA